MSKTIAQMTREEFRKMMEEVIEVNLSEMLGDPDEGLVVRKPVRDKLLRQRRAVAADKRGEALGEVARRLGLE